MKNSTLADEPRGPSDLGLGVLSGPLRLPGHVVDKEKVIQGAFESIPLSLAEFSMYLIYIYI